MKITMGGIALLEEQAESYEEFLNAFKASEAKYGREVPLFAMEVLLVAVALWFLERAAEKAFDLAVDRAIRVDKEAESKEIREHLAAMREMLEEARSLAREGRDIGGATRALPGPPTALAVTIGGGPDADLIQAFEAIARKLPELRLALSRQEGADTASHSSARTEPHEGQKP